MMKKPHSSKPIVLYLIMLFITSACAVMPNCPDSLLPIVEVQINNTESTHDDYVNTTAFIPCRVRITNVNRGSRGQLNFPGGVEVELRNIISPADLRISRTNSGTTTSFIATLPEDGAWLNFSIRGNRTNPRDKSSIIEIATAGATCREAVLSRKALQVIDGTLPIPATPARPRVAIQVGSISHLDDYIAWGPTSCRIKWIDPPNATATRTIRLQNMAGANRLRFANSVTSGSTATNETITLTLNGNDSWTTFYVAGNFGSPSIDDKDAVMEVIDVSSTQLLAREGVMVRIRKNVNALTPRERDRYLEALREVHQVYDFYMLFRNSHSWGAGGRRNNLLHRQAHTGSAFLPWHRAFVLHMERLLQSSNPSVAIHYWNFNQPSPRLFDANFMGANSSNNMAALNVGNPIRSWIIPGEAVGIRRRIPGGDDFRPIRAMNGEDAILGLGPNYANFKDFESRQHAAAHSNTGSGPRDPRGSGGSPATEEITSWIADMPQFATQDPLFFFLHANVDRLWAKWQWLNNRFDATQINTYDLQGSHDAPALPPNEEGNRTFGQYAEDTMWPWDNITGGTGTRARPAVAPLNTFPITLGGGFPVSIVGNEVLTKPTVKSTIDYKSLNLGYDDFFPY